jgi:hypothetical protein
VEPRPAARGHTPLNFERTPTLSALIRLLAGLCAHLHGQDCGFGLVLADLRENRIGQLSG